MFRKPKVNIVIPSFNGRDFLERLIPDLKKEKDAVITLVDNNSNDGSDEYCESEGVTVLKQEENLSFSKANNIGAAKYDTPYILFLNNDMYIVKGFLSKMIEMMESEDIVKAVGAKLLFPSSGLVQHAGIEFTPQGMPFEYGKNMPKDDKNVTVPKEVNAVTAACILVDKKIYDEIGGFDENYVNGWEDNDLCLKIREKNYKIMYQPEAEVYHYQSGTTGRHDNEAKNASLFMQTWINTNPPRIQKIIGKDIIK